MNTNVRQPIKFDFKIRWIDLFPMVILMVIYPVGNLFYLFKAFVEFNAVDEQGG